MENLRASRVHLCTERASILSQRLPPTRHPARCPTPLSTRPKPTLLRSASSSHNSNRSASTTSVIAGCSGSSSSWGPHCSRIHTLGNRRRVATAAAAAAASGDMGGEDSPVQHAHGGATPVLSFINDLTKWAVSGTVFAVLLARRDLAAAWCVLGSIIASFINKALKYIINEQRPQNARKADPGMPSSHANSLAFLGVYTAVAMSRGSQAGSPAWLSAAALVALSVFLTWLRVRLGYHTVPQVLVGYALGAATAVGWHAWGTGAMFGWLQGHPQGLAAVYCATAVAVGLFAVRNVWSWFAEKREEKAAGKAA